MNDEIDKLLNSLVGRQIDITIVHNIEGIHLRSTGILRGVSNHLIKIEIEYRDHWWSVKKKGTYVINRKSCSLLSIFIHPK